MQEVIMMTKKEFECRIKLTKTWTQLKILRSDEEEFGDMDAHEWYTEIICIPYKCGIINEEEYDLYYKVLQEGLDGYYTYEEIDSELKELNNIFEY